MSKLAKGKTSFSVFLAPSGIGPGEIEGMQKNSAADTVCVLEPVHGWSGWRRILDDRLDMAGLNCGGFLSGQLVVKKRTPPASAVAAETEALVEAERLAQGAVFIGAKRRKEIREETIERLAKETPVSYKSIEWAYIPARERAVGGYVVATATSDSDLGLFAIAWHDATRQRLSQVTFDSVLALEGIDVQGFDSVAFANETDLFQLGVSTEFMLWLWYRSTHAGGLSANGAMQAGESISLSLTDEKGSTVAVKGQAHRNLGEIREMVRRGYLVSKLELLCDINRVGIEFTLGADSCYYGVSAEGISEMSLEEAFAGRMEAFGGLVDTIWRVVAQYGSLRKDTKAWKKEAREFQQWLGGGAK